MNIQVKYDNLSERGIELLQGHVACDCDVVEDTEALAAVEEGVVRAARQVPGEQPLTMACIGHSCKCVYVCVLINKLAISNSSEAV